MQIPLFSSSFGTKGEKSCVQVKAMGLRSPLELLTEGFCDAKVLQRNDTQFAATREKGECGVEEGALSRIGKVTEKVLCDVVGP